MISRRTLADLQEDRNRACITIQLYTKSYVPGIICLEVLRNIPRLYSYNQILGAISEHYLSQTRSPNHNDNVSTIFKSYLLRLLQDCYMEYHNSGVIILDIQNN